MPFPYLLGHPSIIQSTQQAVSLHGYLTGTLKTTLTMFSPHSLATCTPSLPHEKQLSPHPACLQQPPMPRVAAVSTAISSHLGDSKGSGPGRGGKEARVSALARTAAGTLSSCSSLAFAPVSSTSALYPLIS